ncbi:MAG: membrane bound O-acyl transferase family-domain-containing protein [Bacteriovoracaceae bacterium]|nr:membrane bound O-acyl transferase family-domain-containing protein [Bacteriovoracaceae bacterium]
MLAPTNQNPNWWITVKLTPQLSARTTSLVERITRQFFFFLLSILSWWVLRFSSLSLAHYLALPLIWFSTEWLSATLLLLTPARGIPFIHNAPWKSVGLRDFWGHRWNVWVSKWLVVVTRKFFPLTATAQLWGGFFISGLFHELMFAYPYELATGKYSYGLMMSYFLLQALGLSLERAYLRKSTALTLRLWGWAWIIIPIPLFTHGALLTLFLGSNS